jgi:hypothetical protein
MTYEQEVIRIVEQLALIGLTRSQITKEVNKRAYVNRAKKPFVIVQIDRILKKREADKVFSLLQENNHGQAHENV